MSRAHEPNPKTDQLSLILHQARWSSGNTAFASKYEPSWPLFLTFDDHSIQTRERGYAP
jgi:hypothetical protein